MEKNRNILQLYRLLFKKSDKTRMKDLGICAEIIYLHNNDHINHTEYLKLINHFRLQRPSETLHKEFYYPTRFMNGESAYWWTCPSDFTNGKFRRDYVGSVKAPTLTRSKFIRHMVKVTKEQGI